MSEEGTPNVQDEARKMGWLPQDEYKGNPELWVDADEYVRRGKEFIPFLRANNRKLEEKVDRLMSENRQLTQAVQTQQQSMNEFIQHSQEQLKESLEAQRKRLKEEQRAARREGNDDLVDAIEDRIEATDEALEKATKQPVQPRQPATPVETPEYRAWLARNEWFGGKTRLEQAKSVMAIQLADEASKLGKRGDALYAHVDEGLAEAFPPPPTQRRTDPTEEGRPSGGSGSSGSGDSSFKSLPADAKEVARKQAAKFVGPNKMFKTNDEWFSHYAKQYHAAEQA